MDEARQILMDLKRKYPEIDVDATLAGAQMVETYPRGAVGHDFSIGGELAGRSMVKSSLAWAFTNGVDWAACDKALGYLRANGAPACFGYYHDTDLILGRPAGVPLHCLLGRGRHYDRADPWLWRIFRLPSLCLPSWRGVSRTRDPEHIRHRPKDGRGTRSARPYSLLAKRYRRHLRLQAHETGGCEARS
jgi:hypothetical protein